VCGRCPAALVSPSDVSSVRSSAGPRGCELGGDGVAGVQRGRPFQRISSTDRSNGSKAHPTSARPGQAADLVKAAQQAEQGVPADSKPSIMTLTSCPCEH
jgi:hypothetical protein